MYTKLRLLVLSSTVVSGTKCVTNLLKLADTYGILKEYFATAQLLPFSFSKKRLMLILEQKIVLLSTRTQQFNCTNLIWFFYNCRNTFRTAAHFAVNGQRLLYSAAAGRLWAESVADRRWKRSPLDSLHDCSSCNAADVYCRPWTRRCCHLDNISGNDSRLSRASSNRLLLATPKMRRLHK